MPRKHLTRAASLIVCLVAYAIALAAAMLVCRFLPGRSPLIAAGLADCAATIVIFAFSAGLNNSSVYDPYWSLAPVPICIFWIRSYGTGIGVRQVVVPLLLLAWAVRLTANWVRRWRGLVDEDWRYADYRRFGAGYWPISFLGFHFFPTIIVFAGCLSLLPVLAAGSRPLGALDLLALCVAAGAIGIESAADRQLRRFIASPRKPGRILEGGLWSLSRHPNYFGEVLFWWGLYFFGLSANPAWWWTIVGPVFVTILFLTVSVPMMDRRMLARHPGYADIMATRSALVPWARRRREE
jgi:steroid 5-alpha reductase family enzyme